MAKDLKENLAEETETVIEKAKGYADQAKGKAKEVASEITDDAALRAKAEADKIKGKAKVEAAKAKDLARDTAEKLSEDE